MTRQRRSRPEWVPTDEAFIVVRECDLRQVMEEGLSLGSGYKLALRDRAGAEAHAERVIEQGYAILRVDLTNLADRIDPGAPMRRGEWITLPFGTGDHSFLVGHIPASELADVTMEPGPPAP